MEKTVGAGVPEESRRRDLGSSAASFRGAERSKIIYPPLPRKRKRPPGHWPGGLSAWKEDIWEREGETDQKVGTTAPP